MDARSNERSSERARAVAPARPRPGAGPDVAEGAGPLTGIRILDLTRLLPGAFCTTLLAGLGGEVVEIDPPGDADPLHDIETSMGGSGEFAASLHDGKHRLALDLSGAAGREVMLRLVESADVLVESYRPGAADRLGLAPATLADRNPRLVHCSLTAAGSLGGLEERGGHDLNLLAMSGVLSLLQPADGPPIVPGIQIGGLGASSLPAVQAILAALFDRERRGAGCHITVSMVHNLQSWMGLERSLTRNRATDGGDRPDAGEAAAAVAAGNHSLLRGRSPCYNVYATADRRHIALGGAQPRLWAAFCATVERPEWIARQFDPGLVEAVRELVRGRSFDEWQRLADEEGICVEPVLDAAEAEAMLAAVGPGAIGVERLPGVWFERPTASAAAGTVPARQVTALDTRHLLQDIGFDGARIEQLTTDGIMQLTRE